MEIRQAKIKCKKCSNSALINEMKYDKEGKDLICTECYSKVFGKKDEQGNTIPPPKEEVEKRDVWCTKCRFKFKIKLDGDLPPICPYCAAKDTVEDFVTVSAQDILNEASQEIYE